MSDNFVTLATFMYPNEAYPLMSLLESEGIECFIGDENTVSVQPFLSNAIGGVKLNIKESDSEKALQILENFKKEYKTEEPAENNKWSKDYIKVDTYCPECESTEIYRKKFPLYKTILAIVLAPFYIPLMFIAKKHYCAKCGNEWKQ